MDDLDEALMWMLEEAERRHPGIIDICDLVEEAERCLAEAERALELVNTLPWGRADNKTDSQSPLTSTGSGSEDGGSRRS